MQMGMLVKIEFEVAVTLLGAQSGLVVPRYFWAIMLNSAVLLQGNNPIIDIGMTTIVTNVCSDSHIPAKGAVRRSTGYINNSITRKQLSAMAHTERSDEASVPVPEDELATFTEHLKSSTRMLALLGAGLSAASGLPTFRGVGGYWRNHDATRLATPEAFEHSPGLVWQFYSYRRHMALKAQPNPAHYALAQLSEKKPGFLAISQNVDGLSQRAEHPPESLQLLHGSLFDVTCTAFDCDYVDKNNFTDPIVPALAIPKDPKDPNKESDISLADIQLRDVPVSELPHCPKCRSGLLRPGVVWFGEALPSRTMMTIDRWLHGGEKIDLLLVIGTSAAVYPAAGYITKARNKGARVAVINTERPDQVASKLEDGDWFFQGDAGVVLPQILQAVTG